MTPSAARAATSACLASAADGPTNVIDISLADGAPYALLRNPCSVSWSALVERGDELRPNFVAPISERAALVVAFGLLLWTTKSSLRLVDERPVGAESTSRRVSATINPGLRSPLFVLQAHSAVCAARRFPA